MSINLIFISKGPEMFLKKSRFISKVLFRNNLIICTKCEIPVMNFHGAPASKLIQNNHLFSRQSERYVSFVSLHISLSEKDSMTVGRVWHFMWHNQGQNHDNNLYYKGIRRSTITITRSSRLIVPSLAEITFTRQLRLAPFFDCSVSETSDGERKLISRTLDDFMVNTAQKWTFEKRLGNSQCTHVSPARESS